MSTDKESDILSRVASLFGHSTENLHKVRFGSGALGRIAIMVAFSALAIAAVAVRAGASAALAGIYMIGAIFLLAVAAVIFIIIRAPETAVLEGAEVIRYKKLTIGTKTYSPERELPPVPDPGTPPAPPPAGTEDKPHE